jgi:thiol-disulfide isomerase/thioredoxin
MLNLRRFAFALLAVAAACCPARAEEWLKDLDTARAEAQKLDRPILLHFYGTWCKPCQEMERNVLHTRKVQDQISSSVVAVMIDVDKHRELANRFGVERFPTDVFIEPTGKTFLTTTGQKSIDDYAGMIARASTRYTDMVAERRPVEPEQAKIATDENREDAPVKIASQEAMLRGYCPVTLWNRRRWVKGSPQFSAEFSGQTYWMSSAAELKTFQQNPTKYAPQLLGCDPVTIMDEGRRAVAGNTRYGAFYDDELFLFTSDANRKKFKASPDKFTREKVVLNVDDIETVVR